MGSLLERSLFYWRRLVAHLHALRAHILGTANRRAMTANSGWLLFDKLARAFLGLLVGAWVARYLGPAEFGVLAYVTALIALFTAVANAGADAIVVRDIAQHPDQATEILGSTAVLRTLLGLACWGVVVACTALFNAGDVRLILMSAIVGSTLVFQASDTIDLWFQSQSQSRLTVAAKLCAYLVSNAIKVVLILVQAPLMAFAAVLAFDAVACALGLWMALRRLPTSGRWHTSAARARRILTESWPFMLSGVAIMVYSRIDQIMIKEMLGEQALGIYAAALPLSQFWLVIPMTLATSLAPFIAKRKRASETDYREALVLIFRVFFYAGIACALLTWCVSGPLVQLLFGPTYAGSAAILDVHVVANVFSFMGVAHGLWLVNERRFAVRLYGTVLAGLCTVILNVALLPRFGVLGAAYTAIVAQCLAAVIINLFLDPQSFRMQCDAVLFRKGRPR